jgi:hypothetical protein
MDFGRTDSKKKNSFEMEYKSVLEGFLKDVLLLFNNPEYPVIFSVYFQISCIMVFCNN